MNQGEWTMIKILCEGLRQELKRIADSLEYFCDHTEEEFSIIGTRTHEDE